VLDCNKNVEFGQESLKINNVTLVLAVLPLQDKYSLRIKDTVQPLLMALPKVRWFYFAEYTVVSAIPVNPYGSSDFNV
jgi:hypothetical protein